MKISVQYIKKNSPYYPEILKIRLGENSPRSLVCLGNLDILSLPKTALFCSSEVPGSVLLPAFDKVRELRDRNRCVISGFHSPVEKDCLKILLRGRQPIIISLARAMEGMRFPSQYKDEIEQGRLLLISPFLNAPKRITRWSAEKRNILVAALADDAFIAYCKKGGSTERILNALKEWGISVTTSL